MKSAVLVFAGLAAAQFGSLPTCAQSCASEYLANGIGDCGSDPKCICENQDFLGGISCCLIDDGGCDSDDLSSAIIYASQICAAQGVTVPSTAVCSTTATGSGTALASASATATATATATASATTATSTGFGNSTSSATGDSSAGASSSATTGSSASVAWAPRQTAALGGVVGGVVAALAML